MKKIFAIILLICCSLLSPGGAPLREWTPGVGELPSAVAWTPSGGTRVKLEKTTAAGDDRKLVWRFDTKESDKAFAYAVKLKPNELPLKGGWFEFSYYLPADSKVAQLRPAIRVADVVKGGHIVFDLAPKKGRWVVVRQPLTNLKNAQFHQDEAKYVSQFEVGALAPRGPIQIEIGHFAIGVSAPKEKKAIASVSLEKRMLGSWNAASGLPDYASLWGPKGISQKRVAPTVSAANIPGQVFLFDSKSQAFVLVFKRELPIAEGNLSFRYYLAPESKIRSINLRLAVREWNNKQRTLRLAPVFGRWQSETVPLTAIVGGDTWRGGEATMASSVEIGFSGEAGVPVKVEMADCALYLDASSCSPLVRPEWITGAGTFSRVFSIKGIPRESWIMALASPGFSLKVNDREIGTGKFNNSGDWPMHSGNNWPVAREWALDGVLKEGENRIELSVQSGDNPQALLALGWQSENHRSVIVSDGFWQNHEKQPVTTKPIGQSVRLKGLDIYPVRIPEAWRSPAPSFDVTASPSFQPQAPLLKVAPAKGKWRTAEVGGRWFLVSPEGKRFFFNGTQVVTRIYENYGYSDWARRAYPDEKAWAADAVKFVKRLGFNGLAVSATADSAFAEGGRQGLIYFTYLDSNAGGPHLLNHNGQRLPKIPDPFDPLWRERLRQRAQKAAARWNSDPACAGFFVNNEAHIEGNLAGRSSSGFVYSEACSKEFLRWINERYRGKIDELNLAWFGGARDRYLKSFDEILNKKIDPLGKVPYMEDPTAAAALAQIGRRLGGDEIDPKKGRMRQDFDDFAVYTVGVYAEFVLQTMREFFPDKLICSNRFMGASTVSMLEVWKDYDIIAWNSYPMWVWGDACYTSRQIEQLKQAYRVTGKPVLLTEWGVQALDARVASPSAQLLTQKERGDGYGKVVRQVVENLPFVAGMVYFAYQNLEDSEGQAWGLVDNNSRPYKEFIDGVIQSNHWLDNYFQKTK